MASTRHHRDDHKGERRRVDLNRASREELMEIPGVSPHMADRIIQYREQKRAESAPPGYHPEHWHMSEREFDELLERLYI